MCPGAGDAMPPSTAVKNVKPKWRECTGIKSEGMYYPNRLFQTVHILTSTCVNADYVCTQTDTKLLQPVKKMPPGSNEVLVYFMKSASSVTRSQLDCLFQTRGKKAYLNDSVCGMIGSSVHIYVPCRDFYIRHVTFMFMSRS